MESRIKTIEGNNSTTDWSISNLYEKSWEIVKRNKVLWLFGMAVAGLASGGSSYQGSGSSNSNGFGNLSGVFQNLMSQHIFSLIPTYFWLILGIEILVLISLGLIISAVGGAWAQASLINAIQTALGNQRSNIRDSSEKAFSVLKPVIWLQIVPTLTIVISAIVTFGLLALGIALAGSLKILFILLLIAAAFAFTIILILLSLTQIWSFRIATLDKKSGPASLSLGFKMAKKKFWPMILLGFLNTILSGLVIGIPLAIMVGLLVGGVSTLNGNFSLGISLLILGGILVFIFIFGYMLLVGILNAFKASVWTIAFNNIRGKYE